MQQRAGRARPSVMGRIPAGSGRPGPSPAAPVIVRDHALARRPAPMPAKPASPMVGIGLVTLAMAIFPLMDAISKLLQERLHVVEVLWGRQLVYLIVILPIVFWRHGLDVFRPMRPWLQVVRASTMMLSSLLFTAAIASMPIADALGVFFFHPFLAVALSPLLLKERVGPWRWGAVATGFLGALIVVRPGFSAITPAILLVIGAGICFALTAILTRKVAGSDPALVTLGVASMLSLALLSGMLPVVWIMPTPWECFLTVIAGLVGVSGFWMMIKAYDYARASQLAPFCYVEIIGAVIFGYLMFGDLPSLAVWAGLLVIVASGLVIAWREGLQQRRSLP